MDENEGASDASGKRVRRGSSQRLIITSVLISISSLILIVFLYSHSQHNARWRMDALNGRVAMTESQIIDLVTKEKLTAYWGGTRPGYLYTLAVTNVNRITVSYVAAKISPTRELVNSRVIATYISKGAFGDSLAAALRPGNTGFRKSDGSVVFYSSKRNTDVYMSFPKKNVQVEIYDPMAGQALSLAILQDQISPIGA